MFSGGGGLLAFLSDLMIVNSSVVTTVRPAAAPQLSPNLVMYHLFFFQAGEDFSDGPASTAGALQSTRLQPEVSA